MSATTVVVLYAEVPGASGMSLPVAVIAEEIERWRGTCWTDGHGGMLAVFSSAFAAIEAAVGAQRAWDRARSPATPAIRIGLSAGDAEQDGARWSGFPLQEASRIGSQARPGQVIAGDVVVRLGGDAVLHRCTPLPDPVPVSGSRVVAGFEIAWHDSAATPRTVVLADDSTLLRSGIASLLQANGFRVVGEAGDGDTALELVRTLRPDIAILDIRMPPTQTIEGIRVAARIREEVPDTAVLLLSQHLESAAALSLVADHSQRIGYLLKDRVADVAEFVDALRTIVAGGTALDPDVVARLVGRRRVGDPIEDLTAREVEVLSLMAEGRSNQAISERLTLSPRTVEAHIASIFSKLGLEPEPDGHRRVLAVVAFLRRP